MTRASMILFWSFLTIFVSLGLYHTSYRTEELGRELRSLNAQIEAEQRSLHILKAEYVFLTNPSRIEAAARKYLPLHPTEPKQIAKLTRLSSLIPTRSEALNGAAVSGTPIASFRPRNAARPPQPVAEETERLNTRMVIRKTASAESLDQGYPLAMTNESNPSDLEDLGDEP